jgi:DNA/RNA-binding domain of Phe-tRNA-synthetase-like protein
MTEQRDFNNLNLTLTFCYQALIDQLQGKIRSYKKQIEEAEEIAALNLAKFRQTQAQLNASADAAEASEQALAKTKARGSSLAPVSNTQFILC